MSANRVRNLLRRLGTLPCPACGHDPATVPALPAGLWDELTDGERAVVSAAFARTGCPCRRCGHVKHDFAGESDAALKGVCDAIGRALRRCGPGDDPAAALLVGLADGNGV